MQVVKVSLGSCFLEYKTSADPELPWKKIQFVREGVLEDLQVLPKKKFTAPITEAKFKDLEKLSEYLDEEFRPFFSNLEFADSRGERREES